MFVTQINLIKQKTLVEKTINLLEDVNEIFKSINYDKQTEDLKICIDKGWIVNSQNLIRDKDENRVVMEFYSADKESQEKFLENFLNAEMPKIQQSAKDRGWIASLTQTTVDSFETNYKII